MTTSSLELDRPRSSAAAPWRGKLIAGLVLLAVLIALPWF